MIATAATPTVEGLSIAVVALSLLAIFLGAIYTSALGVIKMHRHVIACLNENIIVERKRKQNWHRRYCKLKRKLVKRGERTDS